MGWTMLNSSLTFHAPLEVQIRALTCTLVQSCRLVPITSCARTRLSTTAQTIPIFHSSKPQSAPYGFSPRVVHSIDSIRFDSIPCILSFRLAPWNSALTRGSNSSSLHFTTLPFTSLSFVSCLFQIPRSLSLSLSVTISSTSQ